MTIKSAAVILLLSIGGAFSQYESIYLASNTPDVGFDPTRQEIINNFLSNKPLLNYVPVYTTEYGHWNGESQKAQEEAAKKPLSNHPNVDFLKLGEVITRLKTDMQTLSHKTKHVYEDKLRELNEVKKLNDNIKVALHNTDMLKNSFHQNQKQLIELAKNPQNPAAFPFTNTAGFEQFLKGIEGLESMVRNINYKCDGKLGM